MHEALRRSLVAIGIVSLLPAAHAAAGEQWELTATMEMPGMQMPIGVNKVCMKPQSPMAPSAGSECKVSDIKSSGNTTSFRMQCGGAHPMEGFGEGTRSGDGYSGVLHMKSQGHDMTIKQSGRKLGDCANPVN